MVLQSDKNEIKPPRWAKVLIFISIPWAPLIHIITAFLYSGLPGKEYWLSAIMAPRFLVSAFASGTSLLILLSLVIKHFTNFNPGERSVLLLKTIVTYALLINLFFFACELFTVFYSQIPDHMEHFRYLYLGIDGHNRMVPYMWTSILLMVLAIPLLLLPVFKKSTFSLIIACIFIIVGTWIDKGIGLITGGFIPNSFGDINEYWPTYFELLLSLGIYAFGFLILTILYKIAITVREEIEL